MPSNLVVMSMVGSAGVVVASDIQDGKGIRGTHLLALGFVFIALSATSDFAPKVATPFALLVFTGIILTKGPKLFKAFDPKQVKVPGYGQSPSKVTNANPNQVVVPPRNRVRTTAPSGVRG